jgi:hypothetical protein
MKKPHAIVIGLTLMVSVLGASHVYAEVKTQKDADAFLNKYCVELVSAIEDQYEEQKVLVVEEKWQEFFEKGALIAGISEIYRNLCK